MTAADFALAIKPFLPGHNIAAEINANMLGGKYINFLKAQLIKGFHIKYNRQVPVLTISDQIDLHQVYR